MYSEIRQCVSCGTAFRVRSSYRAQTYCTQECYHKVRTKEAPLFTCAQCGKVTRRRRSRTKNGQILSIDYTTKFCSKECAYIGRIKRKVSPDGHITSAGYVRVDLGGGKKRLKHRLVMEEHLGRPLLPGETVHHKFGDRADNHIDRLELWSKAQPAGQRVADKIAFAIEMLRLYPDFAHDAGVKLVALEDHRALTPLR